MASEEMKIILSDAQIAELSADFNTILDDLILTKLRSQMKAYCIGYKDGDIWYFRQGAKGSPKKEFTTSIQKAKKWNRRCDAVNAINGNWGYQREGVEVAVIQINLNIENIRYA